MDMEKIQKGADIAKNIFQVIALIIAGIWTYWLFIRTEVPSLEYRASTQSDLRFFASPHEGECIATFNVTHENKGKSSYRISAYRLRAWTFEKKRKGDEPLLYVNLQEIQNRKALFDERYVSGPFITQFAPDTAFRHNFEWVVKKMVNQDIYFRIDLYVEEEGEPRWYSGSWGAVCGQELRSDKSEAKGPNINKSKGVKE